MRSHSINDGDINSDEDVAKYGALPIQHRKGIISSRMQNNLKKSIFRALFAVIGIAAFGLSSFVSLPFFLILLANAWFAGSVVYLSGLSYGIMNDLIATRVNLPYFTLGHNPGQRGLIESNDPNAVGIAWGILATGDLSLGAAVLFGLTAFAMGCFGLPFAGFVLPAMGVCMPLVIAGANIYAHIKSEQRKNSGLLPLHKEWIYLLLDNYQREKLEYWLKDDNDANAWLSNSDRNGFGYMAMPLLGLIGLVSLIAFSAAGSLLPEVFFSTAVAVFPPLGLGLLLATGIVASCAYLYFNNKKQVNNGYQLDYATEENSAPTPTENKDNEIAQQVVNSHTLTTQVLKNTAAPLPARLQTADVQNNNGKQNIDSSPSTPILLRSASNSLLFTEPALPEYHHVIPSVNEGSRELSRDPSCSLSLHALSRGSG